MTNDFHEEYVLPERYEDGVETYVEVGQGPDNVQVE